jgi:hypothetical protein
VIDWLVVIVASTVFTLCFGYLHLPGTVQQLGQLMQCSMVTISNPAISDFDKEKQLQSLSLALFRQLFVLLAKTIVCLLSASTIMGLSCLLHICTYARQLAIVTSLPFIIASAVFFILLASFNRLTSGRRH